MKIISVLHRAVVCIPLRLLCPVLVFYAAAAECGAQDAKILPRPDEPIPRANYRTWSLFLVSNPEWLLDQSSDKLDALFTQFKIFGDAIGPDNLAVWFWARPPQPKRLHLAVDVMRSVQFCRRLKLKPSEGPYVVVMSEYPGRSVMTDLESFPSSSTNVLAIRLNGTDASRTTKLLSELVDGIIAEDLSKFRTKTEDYWASWRKVFTSVSSTVVSLSDKVTVSLDMGPVTTEIKLGR